jgi:hypothetical protein
LKFGAAVCRPALGARLAGRASSSEWPPESAGETCSLGSERFSPAADDSASVVARGAASLGPDAVEPECDLVETPCMAVRKESGNPAPITAISGVATRKAMITIVRSATIDDDGSAVSTALVSRSVMLGAWPRIRGFLAGRPASQGEGRGSYWRQPSAGNANLPPLTRIGAPAHTNPKR